MNPALEYPIDETYPALYRDRHGEEQTIIRNDGINLRMTVRGITFVGRGIDGFEPETETDNGPLAGFTRNTVNGFNDLCACEIKYEMPLPIVANEVQADIATLHVCLQLGEPVGNGCLSEETLRLRLFHAGQWYEGKGTSGWYEDELLEIQVALPEGARIKSCITCGLSDYSPYGHGIFGDMSCYRNLKAVYYKVQTKWDLFALPVAEARLERVQETYLCPHFERRVPGTGYRG